MFAHNKIKLEECGCGGNHMMDPDISHGIEYDLPQAIPQHPIPQPEDDIDISSNLNDPMFIGMVVAQVLQAMKDEGTLFEGSCGYTQTAPGGKELNTPGGIKGSDAYTRTQNILKNYIKQEVKILKNKKR